MASTPISSCWVCVVQHCLSIHAILPTHLLLAGCWDLCTAYKQHGVPQHTTLCNAEHYGFVLADNPHDTMLLPVRLLPSAQLRSAVRASDCWLHACGTPCWVLLRELRLWAAAQLGCRHAPAQLADVCPHKGWRSML